MPSIIVVLRLPNIQQRCGSCGREERENILEVVRFINHEKLAAIKTDLDY